ncbi:D-alanyl-D-alanine carboxypeptidase/D-alanyl-D-alanine-endopeptidase (penicillin-binding protein 4) [Crenobacter luteus]|uniref:D-alanyl-D-alanine carboxypeptidase/D-alanyl-D-alanine endopeptidase n=1 Tax=Crenobacter luteus TaxID=1452487 RepID=UPI001047CE2F|nr:D-alanyl-D-alanine carboxypeptidase/D-alanyl-D-alanine-endopeptidase [Crenobacter luteus]TCP11038.1 D-alanyl-D-alanine carboxypeptidase/D-alanyl-D-alanine-endopeptidase (penicillin-binding protein 4) [Crenobacter luteus]
MTRWIAHFAVAALSLPAVAAPLAAGDYALWLAPVDGGAPLLEHRADAAMNPASTMKLVTSWAALQTLGPNYRWRTRFVSAAPIESGVLKGDLAWIGGGEPRFRDGDLIAMLRELRRRGVREIAGNLVLDGSTFSRVAPAADFNGDAERVFTIPPDAHLTNLKVAWLQFFHDGAGPRAALDPALPGVTLDARLVDGGELPCGDVRGHVAIRHDDARVEVTGRLPRGCDGAQTYLNLLSARDFAGQSFAALWRELGGAGPRATVSGAAPAGAAVLAERESAPLTAVLADVNKHSNNTMARAVYLTLGRGPGDTPANAERAVRQSLAEAGIADEALVLENGSGLSRRERVSARLLGEVLRHAARGPWYAEFAASLPIAGEDGTLQKRLKDWGPRLRLKTGTLADARALAGYYQAGDGRRYALVALVNGQSAASSNGAIDALVAEALARLPR